MKTRICSIFVALSVLLGMFLTVTAEEGGNFEPSEYGEAVAFLRDLGLLEGSEDGSVNASKTISRAEFAVLALRVMGMADSAQAAAYKPVFTDVPQDYWAAKQILFAVDAGLFSGTGQSTFEPEEPVYMNQAIKVAVCMAGFGRHAEAAGGYPGGYLQIAAQRHMLDGVHVASGRGALRGEVFTLLYNTLRTDMVIIEGVGEDVKFSIYKDRNIMTEYLRIYKGEGIVTADNEVAIKGRITSRLGSVVIDDTEYLSDIPQTKNQVGKNITFYYREEDGEYRILAVREKQNVVTVLSAKDVDSFDYLNGAYTVRDGERDVRFDVGNEYTVVYNGQLLDGGDPELMCPKIGSITLIDNNRDDVYEVIFIDSYYNLIVDRYDGYSKKIIDKKDDTSGIDRDISIEEYKNITALDDKLIPLDFEKLAQNTILTVYKNGTKDTLRIYASNKTISGKVTALTDDADEIIIDGCSYTVSADLRFQLKDIRIGFVYTFYLNHLGELVYIKMDASQESGYILDMGTISGVDASVQAKILTASSEEAVYDLADKVSIMQQENGNMRSATVNAAKVLEIYRENPRQFVLFETNKEQKITRVIFPYSVKTQEEFENMATYPLIKLDYIMEQWPDVSEGGSKNTAYRKEIKGFDNWLILDDEALVFSVPPKDEEGYDQKILNVSGVNGLKDKTSVTIRKPAKGSVGEIEVYCLGGESMRSQVMVRFADSATDSIVDDYTISVVANILMVMDEENDQPTYQLTLLENGQERTVLLDDPAMITAEVLKNQSIGNLKPALHQNKKMVEKGDIVKYNLSSVTNRVNALALMYDSVNDMLCYAKSTYDALFRLAAGTVRRVESGCVEMDILGAARVERTLLGGARVVVYNRDTDRAYTGKMQDIVKGDKVVVYSRYVENKAVVVYKGGEDS